jgi:nucleoside-diphosphate-sugar epimerase
MKITIFGATGQMGQLLARQALDAGHDVLAFARNPDKLTISHPRLTIAPGQLDDDAAIGHAVRGADAVIEGVGSHSDGTRRIITAMRASDARRIVVVSTCSVPDPADRPDPNVKALVRLVKTVAPGPCQQIRAAAGYVRASDLAWTLVRVAKLTNDPPTGQLKIGYYGHGTVGLSVTRADTAAFLLSQTSDTTNLHSAPAISN